MRCIPTIIEALIHVKTWKHVPTWSPAARTWIWNFKSSYRLCYWGCQQIPSLFGIYFPNTRLEGPSLELDGFHFWLFDFTPKIQFDPMILSTNISSNGSNLIYTSWKINSELNPKMEVWKMMFLFKTGDFQVPC